MDDDTVVGEVWVDQTWAGVREVRFSRLDKPPRPAAWERRPMNAEVNDMAHREKTSEDFTLLSKERCLCHGVGTSHQLGCINLVDGGGRHE